ncbi:putative ABC transport system permease protein [Nocardioides luteus]|uniref:ABC transporter permease n=1 Tax=Nocardioides luteus TaxID=1844 RepID=A0ABQ5SZ15_9ACTN|nr:FtsX-like permease family protein [Nocardioides luteus]MDR7310930.1 putative ABC transport system permease protein [Nocardioides luteus]GGR39686.1 ABC transporter permease [Nocardioides luteus]GLJ69290.1 ABC transporter permease [Nocardioides luteus]
MSLFAILAHSLKTLRQSWPPYAGAAVALAGGIALITLATNLLGALGAGTEALDEQTRRQIDDLGSLFGIVASISLFMALFVVSSTFGFVVATRRRELGLLRLLGATPRQVRILLLGEALAVAALGAVAGCLLGTAVTAPVLRILHSQGVTPVLLQMPSQRTAWIIAASCGVTVALIGAWRAGARAGRTQPVEALREAVLERRRPTVVQTLVAVGAAVALVATAAYAREMPLLFALMVGLLLPIVAVVGANAAGGLLYTELAALVGGPVARRDPSAHLARDLARTSGRMTASVAAPVVAILAVAGSMVVTVGATADWSEGADRAALSAELVVEGSEEPDAIGEVPGVRVSDVRRTARVGFAGERTEVEVVDVSSAAATRSLQATKGDLSDLRGRAMAVTESYVTDIGGRIGETRRMRVGDRRIQVRLVAIVPDAPNLWGDIIVPDDLPGIGRRARDTGTVFVSTDAGADVATTARSIRETGAEVSAAAGWIRAVSDQTREMNTLVLWVMLGPAGVYAAIAAVNAVLIGTSQRRRQTATSRLLGATPGQVRRTALWETVFTGAGAIVVGGAITAFTGWLVRQAVVRDVPDAPLTFPWQALAGITAACAVVLLAAAVAGAYALREREASR